MSATYELTRDNDDIVIRLPSASIDEQELVKFLDYLELESILRRSQLSAKDSQSLVSSVKQGAWQQVRHLFED
jgi:hypothetical protein